jgi:hypothetical protein
MMLLKVKIPSLKVLIESKLEKADELGYNMSN